MIETRDEIVKNMFNCNAKVNEEAGEGNTYRGRNELREDDFIDVEWSCNRVNDSFCLFFKTNKNKYVLTFLMKYLFLFYFCFIDSLLNYLIDWLNTIDFYDRVLENRCKFNDLDWIYNLKDFLSISIKQFN